MEIEKCTCNIFSFNYQMWKYEIKREFFSVKSNQIGKYVEKWFIVFKTLIQFLNKATCNFFLDDKATRNLYTWVLKEVKIKY